MATKTQTEREELEEWLEGRDCYRFLVLDMGEPLAKLRKAKAATEAVDAVLNEAAKQLRKVANKYRSMGIGDTATDEAITSKFYGLIH